MERDPTVPREIYDPDRVNHGIKEILRQQEHCEPPNPYRVVEALQHSFGNVYDPETGMWVRDVPYSQANWKGDGV